MQDVLGKFRKMKARDDSADALVHMAGEKQRIAQQLATLQARNHWLEQVVAGEALIAYQCQR